MSFAVGFDIGSKTSFAAVAKAGGVETIANEYSKRETPSYVSFGEAQRELGYSAQQKVIMNLKNTAWLFKHLIGRPFSDEIVARYQPLLPYKIVEISETNRVGIEVTYNSEVQVFSMEQILAMLLGKMKTIASSGLDNQEVTDCVVACPFYLTNAERSAWLEAIEIAGLNPLKLINETTAIALAYGIYKTDLPEPGKKARTVAFVDVGYTQTQVAIAQFNKGSLKVVATAGDRNLGGLDMDLVILEHFAEEFKTKYKMDVKSKKRAELRLYNECEKLKKLMSANATEIPMNVECIMDDRDVTGRMKREVFEGLCESVGFQEKFKNVLNDAVSQLQNSGSDKVEIDSVEIVGGSTRVPFIKELIKEVYGLEPNTTLNADEAVSRGCALQCAILSPKFRVREFTIADAQPYTVRIDWSGADGKNGNAILFKQNESIPISKVLTFTRKDLNKFAIKASYSDESFKAFPNKQIGDYNVDALKQPVTPNEDGSIKVKVKLRIDNNGILTIPQAVQIDKKEVEEEIKEPLPDPAADNKKEEEKPAGEEKKEENKEQASDKMEDAANEPEKQPSEEPPKPKTKLVSKAFKIELETSSNVVGKLSAKTLEKYVQAENELCVLDKKEKDRQDAKNAVEEYVYDSRDKVHGIYSDFAKESEKEQISSKLTSTEDWLYEEGYDENKQAYTDKLAELKKLVQPIILRYNESNSRKPAIDLLLNYISTVKKFLQKYADKDESVSHIEQEKVDKVQEQLTIVETWTNQNTVKVAQMKSTDDPEVFTANFVDKLRELTLAAQNTMNTPKPKPKEEPKKEEKKQEGENKEGEENKENVNESQASTEQKQAEGNMEDAASGDNSKKPEVNNEMDLD